MRGELSADLAPMVAIDHRVLLRKCLVGLWSTGWKFRDGARRWLDAPRDYRLVVFVVGGKQKEVGGVVEAVSNTPVGEVMYFADREGLRGWMRTEDGLLRVVTDDPMLRGIDPVYVGFGGFDQPVI